MIEKIRLSLRHASDSFKSGHRVLVKALNERLVVSGHNFAIKAPPPPSGMTLAIARTHFLKAIDGVRPSLPFNSLPPDDQIWPWRIFEEPAPALGSLSHDPDDDLRQLLRMTTPGLTTTEWDGLIRVVRCNSLRWRDWNRRLRQQLATFAPTDDRKRKIPADKRTSPMTLRRASKMMGKPDSRDSAEWLSKCIKDGTYLVEKINRQSFVFCLDDFPRSVWSKVRPS